MQFFVNSRCRFSTYVGAITVTATIGLLILTGCPESMPGDNQNQNGNGNANQNQNDNSQPGALDDVEGEIVTLRNNQVVSSSETTLAIFYAISNVPETAVIGAFYVPVDDPGADLEEDATLNIFQTQLPAGTNQAFVFNPNAAGTGFHKLGLRVELGSESKLIVSVGVVVVEGGPDPTFIQPVDAVTTVFQGQTVKVSFDAGDPQNEVAWRLFLLQEEDRRDAPLDQLGDELLTGFGNIGEFTLTTALLSPGQYELGISATDSGLSIAATVGDGRSDEIVTVIDRTVMVDADPAVGAPTLAFSAPGQTDVELFGSQEYTIRFAASADPAGGTPEVDIFVDPDCNLSNGSIAVNASPLPITATTISLPTNLEEATYCVGGRLRQGVQLVEVTAAGTITVIKTPTLNVLTPDQPLTLGATDTAEVSWITNVPEGFGLVDVFARTVNNAGEFTSSEFPVTPGPQATSVTTWDFSPSDSGLYRIFVRLTISDTTVSTADCSDAELAPVPSGQCLRMAPETVQVIR